MSILIDIIPSKTYAHRLLICAALSETPCEVQCDFHSDDLDATRRCVQAIREGTDIFDCGESGSTLRFMLPVVAALGRRAEFRTAGRLAGRPSTPLYDELVSHGCKLGPRGVSPLVLEGRLEPGTFIMPGNVSSQFVSGSLLALPLLRRESRVIVSGKLQSSAYVDCTLDVLKQFGIRIEVDKRETGTTYTVPGKQVYRGPAVCRPEGDWSGAANWLLAGAIGSEPVSVRGLNLDSMQGDREIVEILRRFGARVEVEEGMVTAYPSRLTGIKADISGTPDLAPVIALAGACASGETRIVNALRLRMKESDRISTICYVLEKLGVRIEELPDEIHIQGSKGQPLQGGTFSAMGDHRIAMMEAIASLRCNSPVRIEGAQAVDKSYPGFYRVMEEAGLAGNLEQAEHAGSIESAGEKNQ